MTDENQLPAASDAATSWLEGSGVAVVVGPNVGYYRSAWRRMAAAAGGDLDRAAKRISWNWPAFLFGAFWLLYRKLWGVALLVLVATVVCRLFQGPWAAWAVPMLFWFAAGLGANGLVLRRSRRLISKAEAQGWSDQELARCGGVSWLLVVVGALVGIVVISAAGLAASGMGAGSIASLAQGFEIGGLKEGGRAPDAFLNSCLTVTHPAGAIPLGLRVSDVSTPVSANTENARWESLSGGSYILRGILIDKLAKTRQEFALQFDPGAGGQGGECIALTRAVVDGQEASPEEVWAFVQKFAFSKALSRVPEAQAPPPADQVAPSDVVEGEAVDNRNPEGSYPHSSDQSLLGQEAAGGLTKDMPYREARQLLLSKGYKAEEAQPISSLFSAYPEIDCAGDAAVCRADFTSPAGRRVSVICRFSEGPDDGAPMRTIAVDGVVAGD